MHTSHSSLSPSRIPGGLLQTSLYKCNVCAVHSGVEAGSGDGDTGLCLFEQIQQAACFPCCCYSFCGSQTKEFRVFCVLQ